MIKTLLTVMSLLLISSVAAAQEESESFFSNILTFTTDVESLTYTFIKAAVFIGQLFITISIMFMGSFVIIIFGGLMLHEIILTVYAFTRGGKPIDKFITFLYAHTWLPRMIWAITAGVLSFIMTWITTMFDILISIKTLVLK